MCNTKFRRGTPGGTQAVGWRAEVVAPHGLVDTQASGRTHRCAPTDGCRNCPDISAARHRRRPGGPGRYSVAMIRACGVIDAGRPRRGSACDGHKKGTGRGCTPGSCLLCTACRRHEPPYWGAQGGRSPPALLSPHFFGKKWGPRPGRPVPRGAPRCENVEPLIRRGLAAPPFPLWGEGFGRMISAPTGMAVDTRAGAALQGVGRRVRDAAPCCRGTAAVLRSPRSGGFWAGSRSPSGDPRRWEYSRSSCR